VIFIFCTYLCEVFVVFGGRVLISKKEQL
jgi:hypothetical protein